MLLKRAHVKNFRSLRDVEVSFERQTAIIGGNGAGKSTILKAIEKFYGPQNSLNPDDYFGGDTNNPIEIGLTFTGFNDSEREAFGSYINNEELSVVRVFDLKLGKSSGKYYGFTRGHERFSEIRNSDSATAKRTAYSLLRASDAILYKDLPSVSRANEIEPQLLEWEAAHPEECSVIRDDGQFLGFTNVAKGTLSRSTSFVFIPAVRDAAADAIDNRNSAISQLMELVVKSVIQKRRDFIEWQERASAEYRELVDPNNLVELKGLASDLTNSLRMLYEETAVSLEWQAVNSFSVTLPTARVFLEDGGFPATVEKQGNGLQRAFILTLLQHLARATILNSQELDQDLTELQEQVVVEGQITNVTGVPEKVPVLPGLILAIEEPELYQHPTKQRHFARVLSAISQGSLPGVAAEMQIVFASHSPYFVCMDRFEEVRLARRNSVETMPHKQCALYESSLESVCDTLERAYNRRSGSFTAETLRARLHILTSELAEGFFADLVVLVEGESDRAAIRAVAALKEVDLEGLGIAVLSANGKSKLDKPLAIFKSLGNL